jgi:predicted TIM-barrel fold metal-dependent hydrolase
MSTAPTEPALPTSADVPLVISVDDHVVEPPDLWTGQAPQSIVDRVPRVERGRAEFGWVNGRHTMKRTDDGQPCDWWIYGDYEFGLPMTMAAVGFDVIDNAPTTYDAIRPGSWKKAERLQDMTDNHIEAAACFPNTLPRFCGQTFAEQGERDLSLWCVQAYNDWVIDDWCADEGRGRLLPITIVPLWDVDAAAAEVRRCATKGSFAVSFSENPSRLGLPSIFTGYWDPLFQTCAETETTLCMHIGSSSSVYSTSPDAPFIVTSSLVFVNSMGSLLDFIFSGTLERIPGLKIMYSEGQVGWMPYLLERADKLWAERSDNSFGSSLKQAPSSFIPGRIWSCIFDDQAGLRSRDVIGIDQICFETDYPHADTSFPHTLQTLVEMKAANGLTDLEMYKIVRGNAIDALGLARFGIIN